MPSSDDEDETSEHVKEVFARSGLAMYVAQVLEHGIVNSLVVMDLIPSRRHMVRSQEEWVATIDEFMSHHFESTIGRLIRDLRSVTKLPGDLEGVLRDVLMKRNWLAHEFFRERSLEFITTAGRDRMLHEVDECRDLFKTVDERLEAIVRPLRVAAGITTRWLLRNTSA